MSNAYVKNNSTTNNSESYFLKDTTTIPVTRKRSAYEWAYIPARGPVPRHRRRRGLWTSRARHACRRRPCVLGSTREGAVASAPTVGPYPTTPFGLMFCGRFAWLLDLLQPIYVHTTGLPSILKAIRLQSYYLSLQRVGRLRNLFFGTRRFPHDVFRYC